MTLECHGIVDENNKAFCPMSDFTHSDSRFILSLKSPCGQELHLESWAPMVDLNSEVTKTRQTWSTMTINQNITQAEFIISSSSHLLSLNVNGCTI